MKIYIFLFFAIIILNSCSSKTDKVSEFDTASRYKIKAPKQKLEVKTNNANIYPAHIEPPLDSLYFDSIKINRIVPLKLKELELMKLLGRPDSIIMEDGWDCGNYIDEKYTVKVYYYGKSRFIASGGIALLHELYPSDSLLSFESSNFILKGNQLESELEKKFPRSFNSMMHNLKINPNEARKMRVFMIENPLYDDGEAFIFHFDKGKLLKIELWWMIC